MPIPRWAEWIARNQDALFVVAVLAIMGTIFVPMPPVVLDFLLTASITLSVLVILTVINVREPIRFSVFPSVLLVTTAFRLALNVATTRQILGNAGVEGTAAAGRVVEAFGLFVAGADPVIGLVIFAILIIVNFVVISKGATRVSEVAARFTLDAMPGKQMAIDADLNAGLIKEPEARRRREKIAREADFYGAMDGASKFVRGDAIAGIIITLINIIAGFVIGWAKYDMPASRALETFTILTIGDGLVSQIPALVVALSAGLMVTRATSESNLGRDFVGQLLGERKAVKMAVGFLGLLLASALLMDSGLPWLPIVAIGGILWATVGFLGTAREDRAKEETARAAEEAKAAARKPEKVEGLLQVDPMELEIGTGLIRLVDPERGGGFLERITQIRRQLAVELGLVVPPVRVRDNMRLRPREYVVKIRGVEIARDTLDPDRFLAVDVGRATGPLEGEKTREPAFGVAAYWVDGSQRERAEERGYSVVDAPTVLARHLTELIKKHAHDLLTRDEVNKLIRTLKETRPAVVEEVVPDVLKPGEVQKVLQNLLKEGVSIRDLGTILEALGDYAPRSRDPEILTEYVRNALARSICHRHVEADGRMYVVTLDPKLEDLVKGAIERTAEGAFLSLTPAMVNRLAGRIGAELERLAAAGHPPVILCSPQVRAQVKKIADTIQPGIAVLSYNEVLRDVKVESLGMVAVE